jgi:RNA polymerase sigma-70 factor (ECF subfamily)
VTEGRRYFRPRLAFSAGWKSRPAKPAPASGPSGNADRFRETMLPHMDAAYNFARYLSRDPDAAEDIVQNAFLRAFRSFDSFRGDAPKAWLFAIVRNCLLDWVAANRDKHAAIDDVHSEGVPAEAIDEDTPETILARDGDVAMVRATVENLPEPFRETLVLRELEELSYKEIATITGVPMGTVMSRLSRGREMLCEMLLPADERGRMAQS